MDEENTNTETEVTTLPAVPDVTVTKDGRLHCSCYNEHVDVLARLADFGISYTKTCREQLRLIYAIHSKFFSLHTKKSEDIDVCLDLFTELKDINDIGSPVKNMEFIYRVQDKKTKVVLEIDYRTDDKKNFGVETYKVARAGDAVDGNWKTVFVQDSIPIKKNLDETIDSIYETFIKYDKEEDVDNRINDVPLSDI